MKIKSVAKLGAAMALAGISFTPLWSASHREAPGIANKPQLDTTDVYAFMAFGDTTIDPADKDMVVLVANYQPEDPGFGPNYYHMDPDALYDIHVDNNGDGVEDITYEFKFTTTLANGNKGFTRNIGGVTQEVALRNTPQGAGTTGPQIADSETYTVTQILGPRRTGTRAAVTSAAAGAGNTATFRRPFSNAGIKTIADYPAYSNSFVTPINIPGCSRQGMVFAGDRADSFAVNLGGAFDLVDVGPSGVPIQGVQDPIYANGVDPDGQVFPLGGTRQDNRLQEVRGRKNIAALAIEVPKQCLTGTGNGNIGVWSSASLPQGLLRNPFTGTQTKTDLSGGAYVQVSRMGNPLVNELFTGYSLKDKYNATEPKGDGQLLQSFIANPTFPAILDELFRAPVNTGIGRATNLNIAPSNFPRNDLVAVFLTGVPNFNRLTNATPADMLRLNTNIAPTPRNLQNPLGVLAGDVAGFPNGRRLNDDVIDIVARAGMGRLCYDLPIGANRAPTNLGVCAPSDAPTGLVPYTDAAPDDPKDVTSQFPYSNPAIRGAVIYQTTTLPDGSSPFGK